MSRRGPYIETLTCAQPDCNERSHVAHRTLADQADSRHQRSKTPWRCSRHNRPEAVLGADSPVREIVLIAKRGEGPYLQDKLFWTAEGEPTSGFTFGPGFKAYAQDFPEGTRLVVTARIEEP